MAISKVNFPRRDGQPTVGKLGQIAQIAAPAVGLINPVAGVALGVAGGVIGMSQQPQDSVEPVSVQSAISRRQSDLDNPLQFIADATIELDSLDIPDEQKVRLKRPLLLAQQKGGYV